MKCPECGGKLTKTTKIYHYKESGLDNVYLKDIDIYKCVDCKAEMPAIPQIERLHGRIAAAIISKNVPLTGNEIVFIRKHMELKAKDLAQMLNVSRVTVSRWETGAEDIGPSNDKLIRLLYVQSVQEQCHKVLEGTLLNLKAIDFKSHQRGRKIEVSAKNVEKTDMCFRPA
jgi:putative zinc finger/helix-turn-helix YgiT family protein